MSLSLVIWPVAADPNRVILSGRATVRTRRTTPFSNASSTPIGSIIRKAVLGCTRPFRAQRGDNPKPLAVGHWIVSRPGNGKQDACTFHWTRKSDERGAAKSLYRGLVGDWGRRSPAKRRALRVGSLVYSRCGADLECGAADDPRFRRLSA